jgi:ribosomal protein L10
VVIDSRGVGSRDVEEIREDIERASSGDTELPVFRNKLVSHGWSGVVLKKAG